MAILAYILPLVLVFLSLRLIVHGAALPALLFIGLGLFAEMFPGNGVATTLWRLVAPWGITLFLLWAFWSMVAGGNRGRGQREEE